MLGGRKLNLKSTVSLELSNFPQDVEPSQLSALLSPSLKAAQVLDVRHITSCHAGVPDCNRTLISLKLPALDAPGAERLAVSRIGLPEELSATDIIFQPTCDHATFCQGLAVNYKKLLDKPVLECSPNLCFDTALMADPVVG